ncbi:bifunctional folylpolyglutamate synthase/dihydrofolate synthase [Rudanella lutea]|uniref:bifunctional folylpolyglutamate synthase/dihydrofolate synthase n=1 Tax=Rudanella lutea TaxID=451374 RepID=UPI00047F9043|nr:folylpolyglutamate synthase/dihydrofolate synthase family protein [Rudanella lutea]
MTYHETIDYLYSRLPVFHREGPKALKPGLGNTLRLCAHLGDPHTRFRSIHVGGTNGKGSTSHMLASIYAEAGYRVGLYTSPHLKSFTERIRINGQPIPETEVVQFVAHHRELIEEVSPSFFELTVAMAFDYFAREQVDLAIIEVGLGGRLDSTNVITPMLSLITNIGFDHMDVLGDTLPQIAAEKAGIIKPGVPVVIGEYLPETRPVFEQKASSEGAPIYWASDRFKVFDKGVTNELRQLVVSDLSGAGETVHSFSLDLLGGYQRLNIPALLQAVEILQETMPVTVQALQNGLSRTVSNTGLQGRFQTILRKPRVILDTAHNVPGMISLLESIRSIPHTQLRIVIGVVADKNPQPLIDLLPDDAHYYLCAANSPRSLPADRLASLFACNKLKYRLFNNVNSALEQCIYDSKSNELILVTGSNYVISEVNSLT